MRYRIGYLRFGGGTCTLAETDDAEFATEITIAAFTYLRLRRDRPVAASIFLEDSFDRESGYLIERNLSEDQPAGDPNHRLR